MAASVAADLEALAGELDRWVVRTLGVAALDVKRAMTLAAQKTTGDGRLSGVGRKGAKLSVRYDYAKGSRGRAVVVRAVGPWQFVEGDRHGGYPIPQRRQRRRGKGQPPRLNLEGRRLGNDSPGWRTGPLEGGAARARHAWTRAVPAALEGVSATFEKAFADLIRGGRRG